MASTWILKHFHHDKVAGTYQVQIQELIDDNPSENRYTSAAVPKTGAKQAILDDLKIKINADRAKRATAKAVENSLDLANFETFLNS